MAPKDVAESGHGSEASDSHSHRNRTMNRAPRMEPEYHMEAPDTPDGANEESIASVAEDGDEALTRASVSNAPLLPPHLLKSIPSPANPTQKAVSIPWDELTPKQKKGQRSRRRQYQRRVYDRLQQETKGTGVLEAGKAAQAKRGIMSPKDRVKTGRVQKTKTEKSGRQQLLEERKRLIAKSGETSKASSQKLKTRSKR